MQLSFKFLPWLGVALLQVQPLPPYAVRLLLATADVVELPLTVPLGEYVAL